MSIQLQENLKKEKYILKKLKNTTKSKGNEGENGEVGKIGDSKNILWHAGNGSRGNIGNVNTQFLGKK